MTKTARLYVFRQSDVGDGRVVSTRCCVERYRNCEQFYGKKACALWHDYVMKCNTVLMPEEEKQVKMCR